MTGVVGESARSEIVLWVGGDEAELRTLFGSVVAMTKSDVPVSIPGIAIGITIGRAVGRSSPGR